MAIGSAWFTVAREQHLSKLADLAAAAPAARVVKTSLISGLKSAPALGSTPLPPSLSGSAPPPASPTAPAPAPDSGSVAASSFAPAAGLAGTTEQDFEASVAIAKARARAAAVGIARCAQVAGSAAACTSPASGALGSITGLTIVDHQPGPGEVQVDAKATSYRVVAGAPRGFSFAITVDAATGRTTRTCRNHHDKQRCVPPTW